MPTYNFNYILVFSVVPIKPLHYNNTFIIINRLIQYYRFICEYFLTNKIQTLDNTCKYKNCVVNKM